MKTKYFSLIGLLFALLALGCYPDLKVENFETTGDPMIVGDEIHVPATLTVKNVGNMRAPAFKVCTEYTGPDGAYLLPFKVGEELWYPMTDAPLGPGKKVTFDGLLIFANVSAATVDVEAIADCCAGDEMMPGYCRVEEFEEDDNRSEPLPVALPSRLDAMRVE